MQTVVCAGLSVADAADMPPEVAVALAVGGRWGRTAVLLLAGGPAVWPAPQEVAVPGGPGTARSGLVAGLIPLGVAGGAATSAVLVHRLLTFRLHVPLGTLALRAVQRKGYA
ncbi:hypothetical protein ACFYOR_31525 [Streptomyces griseofuscus]|uniref:hypothetical protein n=1 Tax=Streptomyces griseofuscus TaxID=146922 RepID=UPI0036961B0A